MPVPSSPRISFHLAQRPWAVNRDVGGGGLQPVLGPNCSLSKVGPTLDVLRTGF